MEKRKLLLVSISVGVFLIVVVGASLLFFAPRNHDPASLASMERPIEAGSSARVRVSEESPASADPSDLVRDTQTIQGIQTAPQDQTTRSGDVIIIYGDSPFRDNLLDRDAGTTVRDSSAALVIDVPKPVEQRAPVTQKEAPAREPVHSSPAPAVQRAPQSTVQAQPAARSVPTAAAVPAEKTVPKTVEDYWVQTGAFSTKVRAENAMEQLKEKSINSIMEVRTINEQTFFRVRVGPYTSKNEADFWLSLIRNIDGFSESYVSMVKTQR